MRYVARKVVLFVITLWAAITLNFLLPRLMPGSPVDAALGKLAAAGVPITNAERQAVEIQLGVPNGSLIAQYGDYLRNIATLRFGTSYSFPTQTVAQTIGAALPWTLILVGVTTIVAFAVGNLLGPVILGGLFDSVGRRPMIAGTYILSGVLLLVTGYLFKQHQLNATTLTVSWSVVFFFASAGVSAAYLTVSEIFPLETRALAIAIFYALGTAVGGTAAPLLFGYLVQSGSAWALAAGYAFAASLMLVAAATAATSSSLSPWLTA